MGVNLQANSDGWPRVMIGYHYWSSFGYQALLELVH